MKYRKGRGTGNALDAVNEKKQRVLCRCALFYIMEHNLGENQAYRFDVVGIEKNRIHVVSERICLSFIKIHRVVIKYKYVKIIK